MAEVDTFIAQARRDLAAGSLEPERVAHARFTPVRLREGYDMVEVDLYLDSLERAASGQPVDTAALSKPRPTAVEEVGGNRFGLWFLVAVLIVIAIVGLSSLFA